MGVAFGGEAFQDQGGAVSFTLCAGCSACRVGSGALDGGGTWRVRRGEESEGSVIACSVFSDLAHGVQEGERELLPCLRVVVVVGQGLYEEGTYPVSCAPDLTVKISECGKPLGNGLRLGFALAVLYQVADRIP